MRGTKAGRWAQGLLAGACLCGLSACGGGGSNGALDTNTSEGVEQYALAVAPDGSRIASGGTFSRITYSGAYPVESTGGGTDLPPGPQTPGPSDPLPGPSDPIPGPVEDIPPDNGSNGNGGNDTNSPPDESNAGEGNTDRLLRLRASRGGFGDAHNRVCATAGKRNFITGKPSVTRATLAASASRGQAATTSKTPRYVTEDLSGRIWYANPQNGQRVGGLNLGQIVYGLAFSPDGTLLASGSQDRILRLIDARSNVVVAQLKGHGDRVSGVAFSPDGKRIASSGYNDHTVRLWDILTQTQQQVISTGNLGATAIAFAPDGATLAGAEGDGTVLIWDAQTGSVVQTLKSHKYAAFSVAYAPDGKTLASGSADDTVILWDPQTGTPRQTLTGHTGFVFAVRFSPDGKLLATGSADQTVKLWDAQTGALRNTLSSPEGVQAVAFTPDSQTVIGAGGNGNLRAWNVLNGQLKWEQQFH